MKFPDGGFLVKKWAGLAWRGNAVLCRPRKWAGRYEPPKKCEKVCGGFWGREREGASRGQLRRFFGVPDFVMAGASLGSVRQSGSGDCGLGFLRPAGCGWASADGGGMMWEIDVQLNCDPELVTPTLCRRRFWRDKSGYSWSPRKRVCRCWRVSPLDKVEYSVPWGEVTAVCSLVSWFWILKFPNVPFW